MRWIAALAICLVMVAPARADWGARRDPFDPGVVQRYKQILARDPHDADALRRLTALYKQYRTVAKLEAEYRTKLDAGDDWATLVVLARMRSNSRVEALGLWRRAVAVKPDDGRGWLAAGDAASTDAAAARDAYQRAVALATGTRQKRAALTKLIGAARTTGSADVVDGAYAELIALAPKDGTLWLDRGNAQLAAKQSAAAQTSFKSAESLLRADPERQLVAIMNQGIALQALGKTDEAVAEYERALDKVPSGYFLGRELVDRIVETERKRGRLRDVVARLETRWPLRKRGHFEWATLAGLYETTGDAHSALAAYEQAVAKAPGEVGTQRKLIAMLDTIDSARALAQHAVAARHAPGDADLVIALAKRYHPTEPDKALATLAALSKRLANNINVHIEIAAIYEEWNEIAGALEEYQAIVRLDPQDVDHVMVLAEATWRAGYPNLARDGLEKHIGKIRTVEARFRQGEQLARHEMWDDAATAFTQALAMDSAHAKSLVGRARAYESLGRHTDAAADARRAVAMVGHATHIDGMRERQLLVRALGHAYSDGDRTALADAVQRWRFAFDRGDAASGYLLATHHARLQSPEHHDVLVELYRRVPTDDSLGIALARSHAKRREFDRARKELSRIAARSPARAEDMRRLIAQLDEDAARIERELRWEEEGRSGGRSRARGELPDMVGRRFRVGSRLLLGSSVRNSSSALIGTGLYRASRLARGTALTARFDWTKRDDDMLEIYTLELAAGVSTRVLDTRKFEVAAGIAPRIELRISDAPSSTWERGALSADVTLELMPRAMPMILGLRAHQAITDASRSTALFVELAVEVR